MLLPKGTKIIGISAVDYIDKTGEIKKITAKKYKHLFAKLNVIIKKAEKEGTLWEKK